MLPYADRGDACRVLGDSVADDAAVLVVKTGLATAAAARRAAPNTARGATLACVGVVLTFAH